MMKSSYLFTLKNYRAVLMAALFFGCIAPGSKLLSQSLPPQSMAGLMYFFAGIGLFAVLLARRNIKESFSRIQKQDYKWFILATLFGGISGPAVLTSFIAWCVFKEHFERKIVYGMALIVLGN